MRYFVLILLFLPLLVLLIQMLRKAQAGELLRFFKDRWLSLVIAFLTALPFTSIYSFQNGLLHCVGGENKSVVCDGRWGLAQFSIPGWMLIWGFFLMVASAILITVILAKDLRRSRSV